VGRGNIIRKGRGEGNEFTVISSLDGNMYGGIVTKKEGVWPRTKTFVEQDGT